MIRYLNSSRVSAVLAYALDALPLLYLVWALPLLLVVAVVTPPWENPDEPAHMLRISQIADGGLLAHRFGNSVGGFADPAILQSVHPMHDVTEHHGKVSLGMLAAAGAAQWGTPTEVAIAATSRYPPVLYVPAVLAVEAGRLLRLSVADSLVAARMANAVAAALIGAFALSLARRTRLALATLLVLPMTVAMFASAAHDGLMIAVTLAIVACIDRIHAEQRDPVLWEAMLVGIASAIVITARPTNLPMAALPLVCVLRLYRRAWLNVAAVAVVSLIWSAYVAARLSVPLSPLVDPAAQLSYLVHQPWVILSIASNTLVQQFAAYKIMFVGVLGWLDVILPGWYYDLAWFVLLLTFVSVAAGPTRRTWLSLLICLAALGATFLSQYLTWTMPRADHIDGMQGRYFLPLAAILALAVPTWRPLGEAVRRPALVALLGFAAITPMVIIQALVLRYYLVP